MTPYLNPVLPPEVPSFASSNMGGRRQKTPSHVLTPPSLIGSGNNTPRYNTNKRGASKRKQTLLSLLDALNELTNDEEDFPKGEPLPTFRACTWSNDSTALESNLEPNFQDDRDVREWFLAKCVSTSVADVSTGQQPLSMNICKPSERSRLRSLRGEWLCSTSGLPHSLTVLMAVNNV